MLKNVGLLAHRIDSPQDYKEKLSQYGPSKFREGRCQIKARMTDPEQNNLP